MTLYNGMASGLLVDGENILIQIYSSGSYGRARVHSWSASFNGLAHGNITDLRLCYSETAGGALALEEAAILDSSNKFSTNPVMVATQFAFSPAVTGVLDRVQEPDTAFLMKQYARGREPVIPEGGGVFLACTPGDLIIPAQYKVNITFSL